MFRRKWASQITFAMASLLVGGANSSHGQITSLSVNQGSCVYGVTDEVVDGFTANQILIDFDGQLQGGQIQIDLSSGSIYSDPFAPPFIIGSPAVVTIFPTLACSSFVAAGDLRRDTIIVTPQPSWSDLQWAPRGGLATRDRIGFVAAQLTLSHDAEGTWSYLGLVENHEYRIDSGVVSRGIMRVPEASSIALLAVSLLGGALYRRRV